MKYMRTRTTAITSKVKQQMGYDNFKGCFRKSICFWTFVCVMTINVVSVHASPIFQDLPQNFIDEQNQVCVAKFDGCNRCALEPYESRGWYYSCTMRGCFQDNPKNFECTKKLPLKAFDIPRLEGEMLTNCKQALLPDRMCVLGYVREEGVKWGCEKHNDKILAEFKSPLCVRDAHNNLINKGIIEKIMEKDKTLRKAQ